MTGNKAEPREFIMTIENPPPRVIQSAYLRGSAFRTLSKLRGVLNIGPIAATYDTINTTKLTGNNGAAIISPCEDPSEAVEVRIVALALNPEVGSEPSRTHIAGQLKNANPGRVMTHVDPMRITPKIIIETSRTRVLKTE